MIKTKTKTRTNIKKAVAIAVAVIAIGAVAAVVATRITKKYTLSISMQGDGSGKITGKKVSFSGGTSFSGQFGQNDKISIKAVPDADSVFDGWSGDCSGTDKSCSFTMKKKSRSVIAKFSQKVDAACTDSDNGKNYLVKGTTRGTYILGHQPEMTKGNVTGENSNKCASRINSSLADNSMSDCCVDSAKSQQLQEFSCDATNKIVSEMYTCPKGCLNGACIK